MDPRLGKLHIQSDGRVCNTHVLTEDGSELHCRELRFHVLLDEPAVATMTVLWPTLDVTLEMVDKAQLDAALGKIAELEYGCEMLRQMKDLAVQQLATFEAEEEERRSNTPAMDE